MEIRDVYNEIGINYRYFLDWRHKLLAGYLVSIAAIAVGFSWAFTNKDTKTISWLILETGTFMSLVFWALDYRNRDLYHICQRTGAALEEAQNFIAEQSIYSSLDKSINKISHSRILNCLFFCASIGFLITGIIVAIKF